jgi:transposase
MKCRACERTFSEALPGVDEKRAMTTRLVDWIGKSAIKKTFSGIAEEVGVVEGTVRAIFADYVAEREQHLKFETPKWMGIDEIHLTKPRGVVTNVQNNTLVEILHDRNKKTVVDYLFRLPDRDKVELVAMDMWVPYRDAVQAVMPQAEVIIDKFHVLKLANEAMEKARKSIRADLDTKQRRGLMHDRFVLLKRTAELTDQEALLLDGWIKNYPLLGEAYRLKEAFFGIYDAKSVDDAKRRYRDWHMLVTPTLHPYFADVIRAWTNWQPFILAYFDHPVTNAYTESLNSLIRVMSRVGRGYSFEALRAKMLFAEGAHKHTLSRPKFERKQREPVAVEETPRWGFYVPEMARTLPDKIGRMPPAPKPAREPSTQTAKNYGADLSTLARLIGDGEL